MTPIFRIAYITLAIAALALAPPAWAQGPKSLGTFGDWAAYEAQAPGGKLCYMVASPQKEEGKYKVRGEVRAFITHRPADNARDVFSYETGYTYKTGSSVQVAIGDQAFTLFTHENMAWAKDPDADEALARAIVKGARMVVRGTSARGTLTTDTFSLKGTGDAYKAISGACNVTP
jgi:hypothetical protein